MTPESFDKEAEYVFYNGHAYKKVTGQGCKKYDCIDISTALARAYGSYYYHSSW